MVWKDLPDDPRLPAKPKPGTEKIKDIKLKANYYEVTVKEWNKNLVHYDVVIREPGKKEDLHLPKAKKRKIFQDLKSTHKNIFDKYHIAFDGMKSAVSVGRVKEITEGALYKVNVKLDGEKACSYEVILKFAKERNLSTLQKYLQCKDGERKDYTPKVSDVFQLIEIMFRHTPSLNYIPIGQNSFYSWDGEFGAPFSLGDGLQVQKGLFASLRATQWKDGSILLNADPTHAVFHKEEPVINSILSKDLPNDGKLRENVRKKLEGKLKGLKVRITYGCRRQYKVVGVANKSAVDHTFTVDGKTMTVKQYFKDRFEIDLRYPKLNLLQAAPEDKHIYLPIECCIIAKGQRALKQLSKTQKNNLIISSAQAPNKRLESINNMLKKNSFSCGEMMQALEFNVSDKPIELDGRVLPPPELQMIKRRQFFDFAPSDGTWDVRDMEFCQGAAIDNWGVLVYDGDLEERAIKNFISGLQRLGKLRGMRINDPKIIQYYDTQNPESDFRDIKIKSPMLRMLLVILPTNDKRLYPQVKKIGDQIMQAVTQCVQSKNVTKSNDAIIGNLLFKINIKMNGTNNTLQDKYSKFVLSEPVMIMGADVNHPPASDKSATPSVASVVGSVDRFASKYVAVVRHQTSREEIIVKLEEMTKSLLLTFFKMTNRRKPQRLIMYRDGVSDSHLETVLKYEVKAMRAACTSLEADYKPGITFIVVQKRHHTRFFPFNEKDGVGKERNVPPGTLVDNAVTHPHDNDFYLSSHLGIKGTSRPAHYRVLWDDNDFTANQVQCFTYALCHMYALCSKSVSIPAPAYYAHKAAYRGKLYLYDICGNESKSRLHGEEKQHLPDDELHAAVSMEENNEMRLTMFFA